MTDSIFATPTPATGNDFDGQSHAWGMKFTVSADGTCAGGRAFIPAAGRPTTFLWQLWRVGDATKIAESDLRDAGHGTPTSGAWYSFSSSLFATPGDVVLSSAQTYRVCVAFQGGNGVYTDDGSETFPTGTGIVSATTGSFTNSGGTNVMPGTDYLAWFFADLTVTVAGTTYTQSLTGSTTPTGSLSRSLSRNLAGATTPTGDVAKQTSRALSGATTPTGTLARQTDKTLSGEITPAGAIAKLWSRTFSGSISPAGAVLKLLSRLLGGSITPSGSVSTAAAALDIATSFTLGPPHGRWHTGPPHGRWHVGPPRGE